jgi:transketolase
MVSAAAGLATTGMMPFVATFASFLGLLCCEQIRMDVAYTKLPVRLIGHHTGISLGFYGTSHHATEDISTMRALAGLTVVSPADGPQLASAIKASVDWPEPIYFRIGRGRDPQVYEDGVPFEFGRAIVHSSGSDLNIIACGITVHAAQAAAEQLRGEGLSVGVIDMPTIKPLDRDAVLAAAGKSRVLMTVEEHNVLGGLGSAVAEVLADAGTGTRLRRHGIYDEYSLIAPPTTLYAHYKLDADGIADVARATLRP